MALQIPSHVPLPLGLSIANSFLPPLADSLKNTIIPEGITTTKEESGGILATLLPSPAMLPMKIMAGIALTVFAVYTLISLVVINTVFVFTNVANIFPVFYPGSLNYRPKNRNSTSRFDDKYGYGGYNPTPLYDKDGNAIPDPNAPMGSLGRINIPKAQLYDNNDVPLTQEYTYDRHIMSPAQYEAYLDQLADMYYEMHEDEYGFVEEKKEDKKKKVENYEKKNMEKYNRYRRFLK